MSNPTLQAGMRLHNAQQAITQVGSKAMDRLKEEDGEVGSWLIFAALIAAAAAVAGGIIAGWFSTKANAVTAN